MQNLKYHTVLAICLMGYFTASKLIFDKVNSTIHIVIDELYHLPQGILYCKGNFSYWDPKITTLPGLYLVSTALISPFFPCEAYYLRFVNLLASCVNLLLFSSLLQYIYGNNTESPVKIVLQAINLSILPPLYFFSHVYYTDTLSMTFLLGYTWLCISNGSRILIFAFGLFSMVMRQTNVVWVSMVFFHRNLDIFLKSSRVYGNFYLSRSWISKQAIITKETDKSKLKRYYGLDDLFIAANYHSSTTMLTFKKFLTRQDITFLLCQWFLLFIFVCFVLVNKGIVVGDRTAHQASVHIPQIFYFLLFYSVFGLPYVLAKFRSTLNMMFNNKLNVFYCAVIFAMVVHYNTVVHPYLLADNRHYTFYIWNRWFGKYSYAVYATIPLYIFLFFSLYDNLKGQNCISFLIPYICSALAVLCLQKMIEVRYFLVPYIILRLRFMRPSYKIVLFEFIWYLLLNVATFNVFFTKEIYWDDFDYAQRVIW